MSLPNTDDRMWTLTTLTPSFHSRSQNITGNDQNIPLLPPSLLLFVLETGMGSTLESIKTNFTPNHVFNNIQVVFSQVNYYFVKLRNTSKYSVF